jgi:subtilisin family serine protease
MKKVFPYSLSKSAIAFAVATVLFSTACEEDPLMEELMQTPNAEMTQQGVSFGETLGSEAEFVPNEMIVKFKAGTSESRRVNALARVSGRITEKILTHTMEAQGDREGVVVIKTPLAALEAISRIKGLDEIEYAEPNYIYRHQAVSNDPYYTNGYLWGMNGDSSPLKTNKFGSQAAEAWNRGRVGSNNVFIGIIDEGVMHKHPDLKDNIWVNPKDPVDGLDNDGNGYKDDIHGWDFAGNNNSVYDGPQDDHGTHVAGTIGAKGGNGVGVAGVCWNVKMITAKFLGSDGGTASNAIKAIDYFTNLKLRHGINIVATNNSWGGGGYSKALYDAIERANKANILFIAAAGNGGSDGVGDNNDTTPNYPSGYTNANIIAVAAITKTGARSAFSNWGYKSVDLGAPGSGIVSTVPASNGSAAYGSYSGTSMATPHVTGAAALYAASHPGASAATIKGAIMKSVVKTSSLNGKCVTGGRLNAGGF